MLYGSRIPQSTAKGLNLQPSPQKKGGARDVTSMLYVTDNKPGPIPYSLYEKACGNFNVSTQVLLYWQK